MIDPSAPRTPELLLEAIGADTCFTEAVLGDLAEEYADRVRWDGPTAARRWYYRESLRVGPHLLRNWGASLRIGDVGDLVNAVAWSMLAGLTFNVCLPVLIEIVVFSLRADPTSFMRWARSPLGQHTLTAVSLAWTVPTGMIQGWTAARAGPHAGISRLLVVAGVTGCLMVGMMPWARSPLPLWACLAYTAVLELGIIAGGMAAVRRATDTRPAGA